MKLWDLLEGEKLFGAVNPNKDDEYDDQLHLAHITALLGPPPIELLVRGRRTPMFYQHDGLYITHPFPHAKY